MRDFANQQLFDSMRKLLLDEMHGLNQEVSRLEQLMTENCREGTAIILGFVNADAAGNPKLGENDAEQMHRAISGRISTDNTSIESLENQIRRCWLDGACRGRNL